MTPSILNPNRRDWLALAAGAATTLWLPRSARAGLRPRTDPFALGVASGDPQPDGVVLWTRLLWPAGREGEAAQPVPLRWELAEDERFSRGLRSGDTLALPDLAHTVHLELTGLKPDRVYWYRFMLGDAVSPVGRTRTLPAPDAAASRLRVAYASCQRWEHGYYAAWRQCRLDDPDLVLFLGDYIYEYPGASNSARSVVGGWVLTLDQYRARYALHKSDEDLQAMHAACPWLVTWDDHEVQNDYAGLHEGSGIALISAVDDFPARRAAAYRAWYEHMPVRSSVLTQGLAGLASGAEMRVYQRVDWGRLATLYLLDGRQYRDVQPCLKGPRSGGSMVDPQTCSVWNDPGRQFLGTTQERWLDEALARRAKETGHWNIIAQQLLFGPRADRPGPGQKLWNEGWDGYSAARQRMLDTLQRRSVRNAVMLGGDVHENWVGHLKADYARPDSATLGVEFCGTSITSRASSEAVARTPERLAENPHFVFGDAQHRGYGLAEFSASGLRTTLRGVEDPMRADSPVTDLARFEVAEGRPQVERV